MLMAVITEEIKFNFKEVIVYVLKFLIQIKQFNWHLSFTDNVKNSLSWGTLKRHISIGVFVVNIDTGSPVPNIPSKSRGLTDENKKLLTESKWFETAVLDLYLLFSLCLFYIFRGAENETLRNKIYPVVNFYRKIICYSVVNFYRKMMLIYFI